MNYRQWIYQLNPAFRESYFNSPIYCDPMEMEIADDLSMYLMQ